MQKRQFHLFSIKPSYGIYSSLGPAVINSLTHMLLCVFVPAPGDGNGSAWWVITDNNWRAMCLYSMGMPLPHPWERITGLILSLPSQWETLLQSNAISHWLGANLASALWLQCFGNTMWFHGNTVNIFDQLSQQTRYFSHIVLVVN